MDQHHCPEDAPSSWKGKAGCFDNDPAVSSSHQTGSELTSRTPSPLPRCSRGSQKIADRLWEKLKRPSLCLYRVDVKYSVLPRVACPHLLKAWEAAA